MTKASSDTALEDALRRTFADHEVWADPGRARRIAEAATVGHTRHHRRRFAAAGAAASVVIATGLGVAWQVRGDTASTPPSPRASATAASDVPDTDADHDAATQAVVRDLLATAPSLPGSRVATPKETGTITSPVTTASTQHLVRYSTYAIAPGTVDQAIAYLRAHAPTGSTGSGWGDAARNGQHLSYALSPEDTNAYSELGLNVTVVPLGRGVAVRTDAQALWRPARLALTRLPADAHLTRVVIAPPSNTLSQSHTTPRTVTITAALRDAVTRAVARLRPTVVDQMAACPFQPQSRVDTFTFTSSAVTITVTATTACLGSVIVARNGTPSPQVLGPAASLDDLVKDLPTSS